MVGPSGSGKSTLWRILRQGLLKINKEVKHYTMNPKAMPRTQLLGHIDMDTREWTDGVLTFYARKVVKEPQGETDPLYTLNPYVSLKPVNGCSQTVMDAHKQ